MRHAMAVPLPPLTRAAAARLRAPARRGMFLPIDGARRERALLSVGNGQARIYWLVELATGRIDDARFLAFGDRWSHPVADAFSDLARGATVREVCALPAAQIDVGLRDEPSVPSGADLTFVRQLQDAALAALPGLTVLEKPVEKAVYQRKREADWTTADRAWLPLSYLRKVGRVDGLIAATLADRLPGAVHRVEALHDDLRIGVAIKGIDAPQKPTAARLLTDAVRSIHPGLIVEVL
jgi:NifU-like protein involved in Fe-S cluster formation